MRTGTRILTRIAVIPNLELPRAVRCLAPGVSRHERPIHESIAGIITWAPEGHDGIEGNKRRITRLSLGLL